MSQSMKCEMLYSIVSVHSFSVSSESSVSYLSVMFSAADQPCHSSAVCETAVDVATC